MSNPTAAGRCTAYPFTAIVGQEEMKLALILNAIEPRIGGALIMGHRGTGKSTAVRALADVMPPIAKVKGCMYGCDPEGGTESCDGCLSRGKGGRRLLIERSAVPIIELPLGATEDRVCGALNIERALAEGKIAFEPGLLARANRGFLYIDEVNLLEDHLVDLLLDVAASGRNVVERESISLSHPARFVLVGSANPEEGELRPQLLDRFGLHARIVTITDVDARVEIVRRRERFERDPAAFWAEARPAQTSVRRRLARARKLIARTTLDDALLTRVGEICLRLNIESHRGELTIMRSARALAAFEGRDYATAGDVRRVAVMALRHRLQRDTSGEVDAAIRITQALDKVFSPAGLKTNTAAHA